MPKDENPRMMTVAEMAELLAVTDRQVRNWIKDKGLPAKKMPGVQRLDAREVIAWFVDFRISENGNFGNRPGLSPAGEPLETFDEALARKTRAEADLKELQLARERGQVASIGDVERVLNAANGSTRTLIQAFPAQLAPQLIGLDDRATIFTLLQRECNQLLGNLATMDAILEAGEVRRDRDE